jgi:hypothetical protein
MLHEANVLLGATPSAVFVASFVPLTSSPHILCVSCESTYLNGADGSFHIRDTLLTARLK